MLKFLGLFMLVFVCQSHSLTSFVSAKNDFQYTAPDGWYFLQNDIEDQNGFSSVSVRWDGHSRPVVFFILARTHADSSQALLGAYRNEFQSLHDFRKQSYPVAPAILSSMDTAIGVVQYLGSEVKKDSVQVSYSAVYKNTRYWFMYITSNQDYQANRLEYYKSFQGMSFKSLATGVLQKSNRAIEIPYEKPLLLDILGRQFEAQNRGVTIQVGPLVK